MDGARAASMQSPCADEWMQNTVHGLLNAVSVCSCLQGSPCRLRDDPGAHGNEWNMGKCKTRVSRHGVKAEAGRQGMARPAQAVVAKTGRQLKLAGTGRCSKNRPAGEAGRHRPL